MPGADIALAEDDFPVARCAPCGREVLTHVHFDAGGDEHRLCLHCDAEIDPQELRWVPEAAIVVLGYDVHADEPGGCGRPGCGRGNCASRR
jgi:hypothetical protein